VGDPTDLVPNFWQYVEKNGADGCWVWTGALHNFGYGITSIKAKAVLAHRISYQTLVGPIPDGLHLDHLCRNPPCVNPSHLEPVTCKENLHRGPTTMAAINRAKTHCVRNHEFTPANTWVDKRGSRYCRACMAIRQAEGRRRKKRAA
jgi:hypothetical protein